MKSILLVATTSLTLSNLHAATTLTAGDISIMGYSADGVDQLAFVTWVDLDAGTQLNFTDRGWRTAANQFSKNPSENPANSGLVPADGNVNWSTASSVQAGTVIVGTLANSNPDTVTWSVGTSTGDFGHTGFTSGGESILAYQGAANNPNFIFGLYYDDTTWSSTDPGEYSTGPSQLPAVLNTATGNIVVPSSTVNDNGFFSEPMTGESNLLDYRSQVLDKTNWTVSNTDTTDDLASQFANLTFVVPEPSSTSLLGAGILLLCFNRRRKS